MLVALYGNPITLKTLKYWMENIYENIQEKNVSLEKAFGK